MNPINHTVFDTLMGAIIGLARATEGNEDLITESTDRTTQDALAMEIDADETALFDMLDRIRDEKRKLVPNCFDCAMPCGRTSDFDMNMLANETPALQKAKIELLALLQALAKNAPLDAQTMRIFYQALNFIGYDGATTEQIYKLAEKLS